MKRRIDVVNTIFKGKSAFSLLVLAVTGLVGAVESPRIVAHRGNFQYDDNALGGFLQSLDAGVTGFETDVQMTSDGGFVIMHDNTVATTTTGSGDVKALTFAAVTNLTLKKSGEHVPSLQQVADVFRGRSDVFVEFEMKSQGFTGETLNQYVDGVHQIVSSTMASGTYVFTSFSQDYLRAMKTRHPEAKTALISGTAFTAADSSLITTALSLDCSQVSPAVGTEKGWIDAAHAAGLKVALWMVEDLSTWQTCRTKGTDTVTSNHPIQLLSEIQSCAQMQEAQGIGWSGQRYFTNDVPWSIDSVLEGTEGLGKWGEGDLTLSAKSSFTGDVTLNDGTILLTTPGNDVLNTEVGALGNPRVARTVVVSNATLRMVGQNSFGGSGRSWTPIRTVLKFVNSTLDLTTNFTFNAGDVYLHDSQVKFHGGLNHWGRYDHVSGPNGPAFWGAFYANNLYFSGAKAVTFENEVGNLSDAEYRKAGLSVGKFASDGTVRMDYQAVIDVPDMTGNANSDVILKVPLVWTQGDNSPNSGFRKTGAGTLEFGTRDDNSTAKWSNYTGNVDVVEGTLKMSANYASIEYDRPSSFGAARYPHTITVHPDATLNLAASDLMGQFYATNALTLVVKGSLTQNGGTVNGLCRTIFDDATVSFGDAPGQFTFWFKPDAPCAVTNSYVGRWPTVGFNGGVTFTGTKAYDLSNGSATYYWGANGGTEPTELHLDDITKDGATDLTIRGKLVDAPAWYDATYPPDAMNRRYISRLRHDGQPFNMRKTGPGTLLLNNNSSTTTGRIEIAEGVLKLGVRGNNDTPATVSPLGDLSYSNRVALVLSGGTLEYTASDTLGQAACVNYATFVVSNGTLRSLNQSADNLTGWANSLPFLELYDAKFDICGGLSTGNYNAPYGTFIFAQRVKWDGTKPYDVQPRGDSCCFCLGHQDDSYLVVEGSQTNLHGKCEFQVADITGDAAPDVTIGVTLKTQATWGGYNSIRFGSTRFWTGLLKTGPGTLRLNGTGSLGGRDGNYWYTEATRVNGGTLLIDSQAFQSTNVFVQAGAWLGGTGTVKRATIEVGGGFTAAPGQTRALNLQAVELPADKVVRLDVPCTEDLETVTALRVPVVNAAGLKQAKWTCTVNGAPAPTGYSARAVVSGGVVYASLAKSGMVLIIR